MSHNVIKAPLIPYLACLCTDFHLLILSQSSLLSYSGPVIDVCGGYNGSKVDNCTLYLRSLVLNNLMPASQHLYPKIHLNRSVPLSVSLGNYSSLLWAFAIMRNSTFEKSSSPIQLNNITMVLPPVELQVSTFCIHIE